MNTGSVDLESVLNVRRRTLAAIGETTLPRHQHAVTDMIYLKREDHSNSILSTNSKVLIFGELQLLYGIFERYTSQISVYEESSQEPNLIAGLSPKKLSFSATVEEGENETTDDDGPPIVSMIRQTSLTSSKGSSSPTQMSGSPTTRSTSPSRKKTLSSVARTQTIGSSSTDYSSLNLEGKRYGSIELPAMTIIEILEILLRSGLELVYVVSDYDHDNVLHQDFIFSKIRAGSLKSGPVYFRTPSFSGT